MLMAFEIERDTSPDVNGFEEAERHFYQMLLAFKRQRDISPHVNGFGRQRDTFARCWWLSRGEEMFPSDVGGFN